MTLSIEDLKEQVPITQVLGHYGARLGRGSFGSSWAPISCPFCKDSNASASVNVVAGRFLCHQCGAPRDGKSGDVIDVVKYQEGITSTKDAIAWIERNLL